MRSERGGATVSMIVAGEISPLLGVGYIVSQCVGATLGSIFAAMGDPHITGFAVNTVAMRSCSSLTAPVASAVSTWPHGTTAHRSTKSHVCRTVAAAQVG